MTLKSVLHSAVVLLVVLAAAVLPGAELPCEAEKLCPEESPHSSPWCMTSKFWFEAESASGARGDVVGVTFTLHFAPEFGFEFNSISLAVCHDPDTAEIVGEPVYSEEILARKPLAVQFGPVQEDENPRHSGYGFYSRFGPLVDRSPVVGQLALMTVYYRLVGPPYMRSEVSFCDSLVWGPGDCNFSGIDDTRILPRPWTWPLLSTRNLNGTLAIRDGPTTQPDRPPEPPNAVVYPEPPASDEVNLRVRITDALAVPGDRNVPVDVFVTADVEYTGVIVPIDFDERYLRVARVEDHFLAGTAVVDNEDSLPGAQPDEGYVVIASSMIGTRRIAPAGEEFRAATIFFDVLESAALISQTTLESRSVGGRVRDPFVVVRHLSGNAAQKVEARSEFGAVTISHGILSLRGSLHALLGDANFDGGFDIADPILVLGYLFLGESEPLCLPAADYDGDGELLISDPILMLGVLFLGDSLPAAGEGGRVGCR